MDIYQNTNVKDVTATVEWADAQNTDGIRASSVTLQLYADNVRVTGEDYTVVLTGDMTADTWTHTFRNLPVYADGGSGKEIVYTVRVAEANANDLYGTYIETGVLDEQHTFQKYTASYPSANGPVRCQCNAVR